jgi:hypothetical protein
MRTQPALAARSPKAPRTAKPTALAPAHPAQSRPIVRTLAQQAMAALLLPWMLLVLLQVPLLLRRRHSPMPSERQAWTRRVLLPARR